MARALRVKAPCLVWPSGTTWGVRARTKSSPSKAATASGGRGRGPPWRSSTKGLSAFCKGSLTFELRALHLHAGMVACSAPLRLISRGVVLGPERQKSAATSSSSPSYRKFRLARTARTSPRRGGDGVGGDAWDVVCGTIGDEVAEGISDESSPPGGHHQRLQDAGGGPGRAGRRHPPGGRTPRRLVGACSYSMPSGTWPRRPTSRRRRGPPRGPSGRTGGLQADRGAGERGGSRCRAG